MRGVQTGLVVFLWTLNLLIFMRQCICEHPRIILNPLAGELIAQHGNYWIRNVEYRLTKFRSLLYEIKIKNLFPSFNHIKSCDVDSCFVVDSRTQERYPLYLEVPCGHCEVCKQSKVNSLVHRCKLESMAYSCQPIFLTLTYDEENIPKKIGDCKINLQKFFKRLRINLERKGYRSRIRYLAVLEYGKPSKNNGFRGRPHYHAIIWNLHATDFLDYRAIGEIISKSWNCGFEMHRLIDMRNDKAFYYTAKYLSKGCDIPKDAEPPFCLCSRRHGSIGAPFIDQHAEEIRKRLDTKFKFVNKWTNQVEDLQFNRYVLNRIFPSLSRSLPPRLKSDVRTFILDYTILSHYSDCNLSVFKDTYDIVLSTFKDVFYCPVLKRSEISFTMSDSSPALIRNLLGCSIRIKNALRRGVEYYKRLPSLVPLRVRFLEKLFSDVSEVDIGFRAYRARRSSQLALERCIL